MTYNVDIEDKEYTEEVQNTIKKDVKEIKIWNDSELNKITWEISNSITNNENNIHKKVEANNKEENNNKDNNIYNEVVKEEINKWVNDIWDTNVLASSFSNWQYANNNSEENSEMIYWDKNKYLNDKYNNAYEIYNEIWNINIKLWREYEQIIKNVSLNNFDYETIKNNEYLNNRFNELKSNYYNLSDEELYSYIKDKWFDNDLEDFLSYADYAKSNWIIYDDDIKYWYELVKSNYKEIINNYINDDKIYNWFIKSFFKWIEDNTLIWTTIEYNNNRNINYINDISKKYANSILKNIWINEYDWISDKIWYAIWWIAWFLWESIALATLAETWVWLVWLWAKALQWIKIAKRIDTIKKIWIINELKNNFVLKSILWNRFVKDWILLWWIYTIEEQWKRYIKWYDVKKEDILKSYIEWIIQWLWWEIAAYKTAKLAKNSKYQVIYSMWAAIWTNILIDKYIMRNEINLESLINNIWFWLLDWIYWLKWYNEAIELTKKNDAIVYNWIKWLWKNIKDIINDTTIFKLNE